MLYSPRMTNEPTSLAARIGRIEKLETELMRKAAASAERKADISQADMFANA